MTGPLDPPGYLNDEQRRIWTDTTALLLAAGRTARVNPDALLAYVSAVASHRRATALLNRTDIIVDRDGRPVANPALDVQRQAVQVIEKFSKQFGLNRPARPAEPMQQPDSLHPPGTWYCDTHKQWHGSCFNKDGSRCHGPLVEGLNTCRMHPGRGAKIKHLLAVERRRNPLAGEPMNISPAQAFLWRIGVLAREVANLDETVAALEAEDLVWGKVSHTETDGDGEQSERTVFEARLNMWLQLRERREKELRLTCADALHAGVEERLVRLAESQGAAAHRVILAILADFGIPASDERIPRVVPARLRELTA